MTTLIAITTRDAVVMGADSLGTTVKSWIDPNDLAPYFDTDNGSKIKLGPDGKPLSKDDGVTWNSLFFTEYWVSIGPPRLLCQTDPACSDGTVPALGKVHLLTLTITADTRGTSVLVAGNPPWLPLGFENTNFETVLIEGGTHQVLLTVVPECGTLAILLPYLLVLLSRRRVSGNDPRPCVAVPASRRHT